ncbi:hypothetical protein H072_7594 [Dactylellina haptotyla CBS 200.50]|uniref:Rhodopsin domain-containing protein n=1 Tax=Dactylellina haptotyla (strain CBS 200.50) TaxID=1284197 RepID=S8ABY3_DACHA|nr:hypothetical protein H072_7594 [Dactylellina haptotyla CBS 200.50]
MAEVDIPLPINIGAHVYLDTKGNYDWQRPAGWPQTDLQSPETRGGKLLAITVTFTSLAFITVALRIYTRARITRYMGWDDWFIMLAMIASLAMFGLQITAMCAGWYQHIWDVPFESFVFSKKIGLSIQSLYPWILGFMKISILLFYLRLSVSPPFRLVVYISLGFMGLYTVASSLAILFQCWPFNTRLGHPLGSCVNLIALNYTVASLNIATDVFVYLLSWVMVRHLKVPTGQKIAVLAIFSVGALVCVFSGLRFYSLRDYWNSSDPTWAAFHVSAMSSLEANVAIMTSSVPAIKPLITRLFPNSKFLKTWCDSAEGTYGRSTRTGAEFTTVNSGTIGDIEKAFGGAPGESYSTTTAVASSLGKSRHLSDEDLGFPNGFDGKYGPPPTNWDATAPAITPPDGVATVGGSGDVIAYPPGVARGRQHSNDLGWIDTEISMATNGMDIESFKRGNMNARMDLIEALRGGPVGIIPDPPGASRRQSEAPYPHLP